MAATGVIMAFADSYLAVRESRARHVEIVAGAEPASLVESLALVNARHPDSPVNRLGVDRNPRQALEHYRDPQKLDYVNPYTRTIRPSDSAPLRRSLHKGVEQWHRFLGLQGNLRPAG
jgi:uncharacterized iron-regulated membrane protein